MLMLVITERIWSSVIVPHGITDLFHSHCYSNEKNLVKVYTGSLIASSILSKVNKPQIIDNIFIIASIIHFSNDISINNRIVKTILSSMIVYIAPYNVDLFTLYMGVIHVPNHYKKNNLICLKYNKILLSAVIVIGMIFEIIISKFRYIIDIKKVQIFIKSIIISHVIYTELFIENSYLGLCKRLRI
jgi:hypothetical protein